jgi:hypothetical protein
LLGDFSAADTAALHLGNRAIAHALALYASLVHVPATPSDAVGRAPVGRAVISQCSCQLGTYWAGKKVARAVCKAAKGFQSFALLL